MKKRLFLIASAALVLAACAKEEAYQFEESPIAGRTKISIGASFELPESGATKSDIDDDGNFTWADTDAIWIGSDETVKDGVTFSRLGIDKTLSGEIGPGYINARFIGTLIGYKTAVAAISPVTYDEKKTDYNAEPRFESNKLYVSLPKARVWKDAQVSSLNTESKLTRQADNLLIARYSDIYDGGYEHGKTEGLEFKNAGGLFRLELAKLPLNATKVVFTTDKKINGEFLVEDTVEKDVFGNDVHYPVINTSEPSVDEEKSVSFDILVTDSNKSDRVLYIPVPVGQYKIGFKVLDVNGNPLWEFSTSRSNSVRRGHMVKMPPLTFVTVGGSGEGATNIIVTPEGYTGTVYLPSTENNIYVRMYGTDGPINIAYSQNGDLKPANVYLQALGDITTLNINLPESHVELTGEDKVHTLTNVKANTSIGTFVVDNKVKIGKEEVEDSGLKITGGSLNLQAPTEKVTIDIPASAANKTAHKVQININSTIKTLAVDLAATDKVADKIYVKLAPPVSETQTTIQVDGINVIEKNCNLWVAKGVTVSTLETEAANTTIEGSVGELSASGEGTTVVVEKSGSVTESITSSDNATIVIEKRTTDEVNAGQAGEIVGQTNQTTKNGGTISTITAGSVAIIGSVSYETLAAAVTAAADGATITIIKEGNFTIPAIAKNLTIVGGVEGVNVNHTGASAVTTISSGKTLILKNIALNLDKSFYQGFGTSGTGANAGALVMENCSIDGSLSLFGVSTFKNCTFTANDANAGAYNIWAVYSNATFTGCSFTNTNRAVNVYDPACGQTRKTVTFTNCSFTASEKKKAAINIHHNPAPVQASGAKFDVVITNCTTSGTWASSVAETGEPADATICNSALWMVSDIENWTNGDITVNGVNVYDAPVAQIGTTTYTTLEGAVAAAQSDDTITLISDVDLSSHARSASDDIILEGVTLDLNGKTIRGYNSGVRYSGTGAVIKNGTFGFVDSEQKPNYGLSIGSYTAGATISDNITLENIKVVGGINIDLANVTMNNVDIDMTDATFYAIWVDEDGAVATYNSGTINGGANATAIFGVAPPTGDATDAIRITGGTVKTNGEKFRLTGKYLPVEVSGGLFDVQVPADCCAEGYEPTTEPDANGMYTVTPAAPKVAKIGDSYYATLTEAITAANNSDSPSTITMLQDVTLNTGNVRIEKEITLNLNGKTITNNAPISRLFRVYNGVDFTIDGKVSGSSMVIPESNKSSYGFVNIDGSSTGSTLTVNGGSYSGAMLNGVFFKTLGTSQTVTLNGVTCVVDNGDGQKYGNMTATDINGIGGVFEAAKNSAILNVNGGVFTSYSTREKNNMPMGIFNASNATVTLKGATIISESAGGIEMSKGEITGSCISYPSGQQIHTWANAAIQLSSGSSTPVVINSGEYRGEYGINVLTSGTNAIINGGTFEGHTSALHVHGRGYDRPFEITINAGTFIGSGSGENSVAIETMANDRTHIVINGGKFTGQLHPAATEHLSITGGTFDHDPSAYVADGYAATLNGNVWVVDKAQANYWIDCAAESFASVDDNNKIIEIATAAQLAKLSKDIKEHDTYPNSYQYTGYTFKLTADIDLAGKIWTPIGGDLKNYYSATFRGTFDGDGHKISNMHAVGGEYSGLFGPIHTGMPAVIKKLKIDNFKVESNHYAGAIVAWMENADNEFTITECTVSNGTITSSPEYTGDKWDNGDKAGGLVGYLSNPSDKNAVSVTYNEVSNVNIIAYRDFGGLVGCATKEDNCNIYVTNNAISNVKLYQDNTHPYKNEEITTYDAIVGRGSSSITSEGNTVTNVTKYTGTPDNWTQK